MAKNAARKPTQSKLDQAFCKVAASNCDREALIEVIREFQVQIAWMFLTVHDGSRPASEAAEDHALRIACQDLSTGLTRDISRMRLLPDELHDLFEDFLSDVEDTDVADAPAGDSDAADHWISTPRRRQRSDRRCVLTKALPS